MFTPKLNFSSIRGKVPIYKSSGTGRDTYVMHDSGGFLKASSADALIRSGSLVRSFSASRLQTTAIEGKTMIYRSDGTGRDGYIVLDSGGFTSRTGSRNGGESFLGNLRTYERIKTPQYGVRDYFDWAQRTRTGREAENEFTKQKIAKGVTFRLSSPRKTNRSEMRPLTARTTTSTKSSLQGLQINFQDRVSPNYPQTARYKPTDTMTSEYLVSPKRVSKIQINAPPADLTYKPPSSARNVRHIKTKSAMFISPCASPKFTNFEGVRVVAIKK